LSVADQIERVERNDALNNLGPPFMLPSDGRNEVHFDIGPIPLLSKFFNSFDRQIRVLKKSERVSEELQGERRKKRRIA